MTPASKQIAAAGGLLTVLALPIFGQQGAAPSAQGTTPATPVEPNRGGTIDLTSTDPAVALARMLPADGYAVNLFTSEKEFPELAKPMAMTFDTRGRLWVLTSPSYPHALPGVAPNDKLLILDDTNGDGRADTIKVFADKLYQPMGFELGDGGAYVSQQPNLVFLRDTNGDDRADERQILLQGFGTEDSHHSIHAFQWGPGGDLYFQEGTFFHSQIETPYGALRVDNGGVYRYEPRTAKLSAFVTYNFHNPWGHVVDRWGQHFISDASNGNNYWATPFSGHLAYPAKQDLMKVWTLTQVRPTGGIEFIRSRQFPDAAQNNFLVANVIGFQGIKQYKVLDEGAGFVGVEVEPLLRSTDPNFRPVALQFGPDGALYVADWFNPLIGHMQYSMRDPRRDKVSGRVWRVTAKGRGLATPPAIEGQSIAAQLDLLRAYEDRTRYRARRALRVQPTGGVTAALKTWIEGLDRRDPDHEHHLLEALWIYEQHGVVEVDLLKRVLQAEDMRARAAGLRVLQHWYAHVPDGLALLKAGAKDPALRVRVEAVRSLSFVPTVDAAAAALTALESPTDYYMDFTLRATIRALEPVWKTALAGASSAQVAPDNPTGMAYLLNHIDATELAKLPGSVPVHEALLRRSGIDAQARRTALEGLARARNRTMVQELVAAVDRVDGEVGRSTTARDLMGLAIGMTPAEVAGGRTELERLALGGKFAETREGAFLALVRADDALDPTWRLAVTPQSRIDLLNGLSRLETSTLWPAVYDRIRPLLEVPNAAPGMTQPIRARYVRIALPGSVRDLSLSEVQILSAGVNIARGAHATQSSVVAGGTVGGQASAAIDGNSDGGEASASFTNDQRDPWWEIDLGEPRAIDSVTLWNRTDVPPSTRDGFHLSVMDAARQPVAILDGLRSADPTVTIDIGGDYGPRVMRAAINALAQVPNRHAEIFRLLVGFIERGGSQRAAIDAVRRIPRASWPAEGLGALARGVVRYAQSVPASERTDAAFAEVIAFGRELARDLPAADRSAISAALDDATVRVIQIKAKVGAMQWEVRQFSVQPNELVEIEIVNPDIMPHNLLITAPGKLEAVGRAAEAMAALPDAFERQFVPDTPDVLFKTRLINANQTDRLRFRAPSQPGAYPYVCSFPGHWQTMNGVMTVNAGSGRRGGRPGGPPSSQGSRGGGPPGGVAITPAR